MSDSKKLPILKDKKDKTYWRRVRSTQKNKLRSFKPSDSNNRLLFDEENTEYVFDEDTYPGYLNYEDLEIPNPKTIINDYDYCDYVFDERFYKPNSFYSYEKYLVDKEKYKRK